MNVHYTLFSFLSKYHLWTSVTEPQHNVYSKSNHGPLIHKDSIYSMHHLFLNHCVSCNPVTPHAYGWMISKLLLSFIFFIWLCLKDKADVV